MSIHSAVLGLEPDPGLIGVLNDLSGVIMSNLLECPGGFSSQPTQEELEKETEILYLLVHSPNGYTS